MKTWVFTAILLVGSISVSLAAECPKADYQARLTALGFKDVASVGSAVNDLLALAKGQDDACKEQLVFQFREYYFCSLSTYNDGIESLKISEENEDKLDAQLAVAGWRVASSEGNYYIAEVAGWADKALKDALPPSYKKYLELRSKEIAQGFSEDAGLLITWEELRTRIIAWEEFLAEFPAFVEKCSIQDYQQTYLRVYLTGMDNSRAFGFEGNRLEKEVQLSYEKFIAENKKSAYHKLISDYYQYLKQHDFKEPADLDDFLAKKGYKSFLATQPPTY